MIEYMVKVLVNMTWSVPKYRNEVVLAEDLEDLQNKVEFIKDGFPRQIEVILSEKEIKVPA